jgi:lipopolysaccharide transport system permease protein
MKEMFLAVWHYRHFILSSIKNDLRSRFARSKLGALWMVLQPLAQVMTVVLQLLFWLTPIVYMPSIIPDRLRAVLEFNPMMHMVVAFQNVLLYGRAPGINGMIVLAVASTILLLFALALFRRAAPEMVDVL